MTQQKFSISSQPNQTPEFLLEHCRDELNILAWFLLRGENERYLKWLTWQEFDAYCAYKAVCRLIDDGFNPNNFRCELEKGDVLYLGLITADMETGTQHTDKREPMGEREPLNEGQIFELVFDHIISNRIDVTSNYRDWLTVGAVLRSNYPDDTALRMFHTISQFYPKYTERETDTIFRSLAHAGYGLGAFYSVCGRHGVYVKDVLKNRV